MPKFAFPLLAAGAALLAQLVPAQAESLACQTVNGQTVCMRGSGTLSCQTVNGRTTCSSTPGEASAEMPSMPPMPSMPSMPPMAMPSMPMPGGDVIVQQQDGSLRVRVGGVDVRID